MGCVTQKERQSNLTKNTKKYKNQNHNSEIGQHLSNKSQSNMIQKKRGKLIEPPNINKPLTFSDLNIQLSNDKLNLSKNIRISKDNIQIKLNVNEQMAQSNNIITNQNNQISNTKQSPIKQNGCHEQLIKFLPVKIPGALTNEKSKSSPVSIHMKFNWMQDICQQNYHASNFTENIFIPNIKLQIQ